MKAKIKIFIHFLKKDIWKIPKEDGSRLRSFSINQLKIILLAIKKFDQKNGRLHAASMTYYSVLALVPALTLLYGLMKGFGLEDTLKAELNRYLLSHQDLIDTVFNLSETYVTTIQGGIFAMFGLVFLLWSVFKTLSALEVAFNHIWGVKEPKPLLRKLSDYLAVFLICPLLIILAGSLTVFVSTQIPIISQNTFMIGQLEKFIYAALLFLPFIVTWAVFSFIYVLMPNTWVNFQSGIWGGLIAGVLYQIAQWGYIISQAWINRSSGLYGSLAAFPLFLIWLRLSWIIMLFGAEVSFAKQYLKTYSFEPDINPSQATRKLVALLIMYLCVKDFEKSRKSRTAQEIAEHLHLPGRLAQEMLFELVQNGLLSQIHLEESRLYAYQPARTADSITISDVLETLENAGQTDFPFNETAELKTLREHVSRLNDTFRQGEGKVLLKDLT